MILASYGNVALMLAATNSVLYKAHHHFWRGLLIISHTSGGSREGHGGHVPPPSYFLIHYLIATTLTGNYSKPWPINSFTSYLYRSYQRIIPYAYRINNLSFGFPLTNGTSFMLKVLFVILISACSRVSKF